MIVNYGPASRIADNEILLRLKEIENDALKKDTSISEISQTVNDITTRVEHTEEVYGNTETKYSELKQTVDGFTFVDETDGITKIKGSCIETGSINLTDSITFSQIGGTVSYNQLDYDTLATIEGAADSAYEANKNASVAISQAASALSAAETAEDKAIANENLLDTFRYGNTTYIDGSRIYSNSIYSDAIHLGGELNVYNTSSGSTKVGFLGYTTSNLQDGGSGIHMAAGNSGNNNGGEVAVSSNGAAIRLNGSDNEISIGSSVITVSSGASKYYFRPSYVQPGSTSGALSLGTQYITWNQIHASDGFYKNGTAITSDKNLKNNIEDLPEKYITMFDNMSAKRYKLNDGTSDRYHVGFVSQEVENAMTVAGIDSQEFGGFVIDKYEDEDGNEQTKYMLRYDEFIGILTAKIKQLEARVEELEAR